MLNKQPVDKSDDGTMEICQTNEDARPNHFGKYMLQVFYLSIHNNKTTQLLLQVI